MTPPDGTPDLSVTQQAAVVPPPQRPARNILVGVLAAGALLLIGIVIGMLLTDSGAKRTGTDTTSPTSAITPEATATDEQMQDVLALIRAQPRREANDPYAVGAVDAPVVLIEYADYRCSYCGRWALETKPGLMAQVEEGTLRIEWRDFPVFQNESIDLAVAARAAAQQGLFWEYNEAIFRYQFADGNQDFTPTALIALAEKVGVPDLPTFATDLTSETLRAEVQAEYEASLAVLGRPSTPQFLVNDQYLGGALPLEEFQTVIEQELARL